MSEKRQGFHKGDRIIEVLRGAGYETREEGTILRVSKGVAYVDNGPGNDPTPYDAVTGKYDDDFTGFSRRIEHA